ncbi:MAG: tyrosine-type recombinase/integrase [Selenomonas artemidis]
MPTKRKDGRYQSSVTVENPITGEKVKRYIYAYNLRDLEVERRRVLAANVSDFLAVETFHNFAEEFLAAKRDVDKLERSTISTYRKFLDNHILPSIPAEMKIADVKPVLIKKLLAKIKGDGSRRTVYILLFSIFKAAKFEQLIAINPMDFVRKHKNAPVRAGIVTPEIYHALLSKIEGTQLEYLYKFAWDTGLRRGEIVALRWSDLDWERMMVHVTKSRKYAGGEYEGAPKTASSIRNVTLTTTALKNLLEWKKILAKSLFARGIRISEHDYVFRSLRDITQPMTLGSLSHSFFSLKRKLELQENLRFHSFRHTHATLLAEQEVSAKKIQVRLGHSSAAFTMDHYIHNTDHMQDGITNKIDHIGEKYGR